MAQTILIGNSVASMRISKLLYQDWIDFVLGFQMEKICISKLSRENMAISTNLIFFEYIFVSTIKRVVICIDSVGCKKVWQKQASRRTLIAANHGWGNRWFYKWSLKRWQCKWSNHIRRRCAAMRTRSFVWFQWCSSGQNKRVYYITFVLHNGWSL